MQEAARLALSEAGKFRIDYEVFIKAPVERTFKALIEDVASYWSHTWSENPHSIVLEPRIGGRFYEQFDESGSGVLYGTVEMILPPWRLRYSGNVGMLKAVHFIFDIELCAQDGGTLLKETTLAAGDVSEKMIANMLKGSEDVYGVNLKRLLEGGAPA
jgi:hypothetical protein